MLDYYSANFKDNPEMSVSTAASIANAATNIARIANDTDTIIQAVDSASSVWDNIKQTAIVCLVISMIVLIIVIYLYTTDKSAQKKESFTEMKGATTVALYADYRGDNPQILQQYMPGERLDRIFNMQLRSGFISSGKHRITIWVVNTPPNVNGNPYAFLRPLDEVDRYNPGLFRKLAVIQPNETKNLDIREKIDRIRLLVEPV